MDSTVATASVSRHRVLPETRPAMLKGTLRNPETDDLRADIGRCLQRAANGLDWSLKELAGALQRDERQVARWLNGQERVQVDVVFAVEALRQPFALQMSKLAGATITVHAHFSEVA